MDPARGTTTAFSGPDTTSTSPVWSSDDRHVVYSLLPNGAFDLHIRDVRPGAGDRPLLHTDGMKVAESWSGDGKFILFS